MTPQEKKRLSLERDRRNVFGENDKSSRTAIRKRKKWVNQTHRRGVNQVLSHVDQDPDDLSSEAQSGKRKSWKKSPDMPLGEMLLRDAQRTLEYNIWKKTSTDPGFLDRLEVWLAAGGVPKPEIHVIMRRGRSVAMERNSSELNLNQTTVNALLDFLKKDGRKPNARALGIQRR